MGLAPVIGITCAFDDGTDPASLKPGSDLVFQDREYAAAVEAAGGVPVMVPILKSSDAMERLLDRLDGLLFSGGGGFLRQRHLRANRLPDLQRQHPARYAFEVALMRLALARDMPILGICRGHQMINRVMGGRNHLSVRSLPGRRDHYQKDGHPVGSRPAHRLLIARGSHLYRILGTEQSWVNSLHRQAVAQVRPPMRAVAWSDDGVVEAIESGAHRFVLVVQFHPEIYCLKHPEFRQIFQALVEEARQFRERTAKVQMAASH